MYSPRPFAWCARIFVVPSRLMLSHTRKNKRHRPPAASCVCIRGRLWVFLEHFLRRPAPSHPQSERWGWCELKDVVLDAIGSCLLAQPETFSNSRNLEKTKKLDPKYFPLFFHFKLPANTFPECIRQDLSRGVLGFVWLLQELCCLKLKKIDP